MALSPLYLADKSALARMREASVASRVGPLLQDRLVATCPVIDLEVLYSARSPVDYERIRAERRALPTCPITAEVTDRALDVQRMLAAHGRHRVPLPDLLIAAVAELNDLTVLHYDADFDRIAGVTGQPVSWVAPPGSIP